MSTIFNRNRLSDPPATATHPPRPRAPAPVDPNMTRASTVESGVRPERDPESGPTAREQHRSCPGPLSIDPDVAPRDPAADRAAQLMVRAATGYDEATKLLAPEKIDLIVVNMDYKGIDAVQATKHLKAQQEFAEVPIVLTSVQTSAKVRTRPLRPAPICSSNNRCHASTSLKS